MRRRPTGPAARRRRAGSGRAGRGPRPAAALAVAAALTVAGAACGGGEPEASTATSGSADVEAFCVQFPQRDAGVALRLPADPQFAGNPAAARELMRFAADGPDKHAPAPVRDAVTTYVAALRTYEPGRDPLADPAVGSAVAAINRWLRANCSPPTTR